MGIIKRTHKKFEYIPRYYKGKGNPYKIEGKFDEFRTTLGKHNLKGKINNAIQESKQSKGVNKTILIIIGILVFISLYILDFDLSIFQMN